jgi:transposase
MRGAFVDQGGLFSYVAPEARVPAKHPLRKIRELVRDVLSELNRSLGRLYASEGRPSISPEHLLSALLLQVFYGIRSQRQLREQLDYNLLYRWFVGFRPTFSVGCATATTSSRFYKLCSLAYPFASETNRPSNGSSANAGAARGLPTPAYAKP